MKILTNTMQCIQNIHKLLKQEPFFGPNLQKSKTAHSSVNPSAWHTGSGATVTRSVRHRAGKAVLRLKRK